jgi:hypothetical protein
MIKFLVADLNNDDFFAQIEESKKYKCQVCDHITDKPNINFDYLQPKRCAYFCCSGPVKEYIEL